MSAEHDLQQLREALEAAVALDNAWWNDEHADAFAALSRVGERIDAQQRKIQELESLVAKSAQNADVRADAGVIADAAAELRSTLMDAGAAGVMNGVALAAVGVLEEHALTAEQERDEARAQSARIPAFEDARATVLEKLATEQLAARVQTLREALEEIVIALELEAEGCTHSPWLEVALDTARATSGTDNTADVGRSMPDSAAKLEASGPVSGAGGNT